jgi:environmental stress-induced protein Ves
MKILAKSQFRRATWKNGLGYTDEIAIFPETASLKAGDFVWRLSSARIEQASAFSSFPDHDRVLVVLSGQGVRLFHRFEEGEPEECTELPPFSAYDFPGDIQSRCELVNGTIQDLSVFIRKGEADAQVRPIELSKDEKFEWNPEGRWNFALAVDAGFSAEREGEEKQRVERGDCLRVDLDRPGERSIQIQTEAASAHLILVEIGSST